MISLDTEEACDKRLTLAHDKNRKETRNRRELRQPNKVNTIISGENLKAFFLRSGRKQGCLFSPLLFNNVQDTNEYILKTETYLQI